MCLHARTQRPARARGRRAASPLALVLGVTLALSLVASANDPAADESGRGDGRVGDALEILANSLLDARWRYHELRFDVPVEQADLVWQRGCDLLGDAGPESARAAGAMPEAQAQLGAWARQLGVAPRVHLVLQLESSSDRIRETWQTGSTFAGWPLQGPHGKSPSQRVLSPDRDAWYLPAEASTPEMARDSGVLFSVRQRALVRTPAHYLRPLVTGMPFGRPEESAADGGAYVYLSPDGGRVQVTMDDEGLPRRVTQSGGDGRVSSRCSARFAVLDGRVCLWSLIREDRPRVGPSEFTLTQTESFEAASYDAPLRIALRAPCGAAEKGAVLRHYALEEYDAWPPVLREYFVPGVGPPWLAVASPPAPAPETRPAGDGPAYFALWGCLALLGLLLVGAGISRRSRLRRNRGASSDAGNRVGPVLPLLVLGAGLLLGSCDRGDVSAPSAESPVPVVVRDLGVLDADALGPKSAASFAVRWPNDTSREVLVARVLASCSCARASLVRDVAPPDGEIELAVELRLDGRRGPLRTTLTLLDPTNAPIVTLRLHLEVVRALAASPPLLDLPVERWLAADRPRLTIASSADTAVEVEALPVWLTPIGSPVRRPSGSGSILTEFSFALQEHAVLAALLSEDAAVVFQETAAEGPTGRHLRVPVRVSSEGGLRVQPAVVRMLERALEAEFALRASLELPEWPPKVGEDVSRWVHRASADQPVTLTVLATDPGRGSVTLRAQFRPDWPKFGSLTLGVGPCRVTLSTIRQ